MIRKLAVLTLLCLSVAGWTAVADRPEGTTVTIMTQNMDDGTDQTYIIAGLTGVIPLPDAVDLTFAELQASNFQVRAELLAAQVAEIKPELVALQEAALWRFGPTPETATTVLFDLLALFLSALDQEGVSYDVVAVNRLSDLAVPGGQIEGALRFTDRNVVLVRSDLRAAPLPPLQRSLPDLRRGPSLCRADGHGGLDLGRRPHGKEAVPLRHDAPSEPRARRSGSDRRAGGPGRGAPPRPSRY